MIVVPTVTISIDRSSLNLAALVLDGSADSTLGITEYVGPQRQARLVYMPDSRDLDGSQALASSWQQALMTIGIDAKASTEAALQTALNDLQDALGQFSYTVTVTTNGVAETWTCDPGSLTGAGRDYADLRDFRAERTATIPCYPIPGA